MDAGDRVIVDTDNDGIFTDEAVTSQTDNDRYINSTVTYRDGSTSSVTLELITLSNGTQVILVNGGAAASINAASAEIKSITLGRFDTTFDNRYNQVNFNTTITNSVVCFCAETLIRTPTGQQSIASLRAGDAVMTTEAGAQKIVWIGERCLSSAELVAHPQLKPVRIRANALARGVPAADLLVSPQHRILVVSKIAERMFGQKAVFVPALKLIGMEGIEQARSAAPVTYVHLLLEQHQVIFANGAPAESLYTGAQAMQAMSAAARAEIFRIFPELSAGGQSIPLAHPAVQQQALVRSLLARHQKNKRQLVSLGEASGTRAA